MKAKKSLGQNFLKSKEAINKIIASSCISKDDIIIEIGPGKGALTEAILQKCFEINARLVAIEKDVDLIDYLRIKFKNFGNIFVLRNDDILNVNIIDLINENNISESKNSENKILKNQNNIKIIANIPYYITGSIIKKFVDENIVNSMTLLVQKEVADRIVSRDNKESILSLSVKSYGRAKYITKVSAKYFTPIPKVDSAVIHIEKYQDSPFTKNNREIYFDLIKNGLQYKRKTLKNNLKNYCKENDINIDNLFSINKIDENIRGEDIHFEIWLKMANYIVSLYKSK